MGSYEKPLKNWRKNVTPYKEILIGLIQGQQVMVKVSDEWVKLEEAPDSAYIELVSPGKGLIYDYKVEPKKIEINGFTVDKGLEDLIPGRVPVWVEEHKTVVFAVRYGENEQKSAYMDSCIKHGLVHLTQEAAEASQKARLLIDPAIPY